MPHIAIPPPPPPPPATEAVMAEKVELGRNTTSNAIRPGCHQIFKATRRKHGRRHPIEWLD